MKRPTLQLATLASVLSSVPAVVMAAASTNCDGVTTSIPYECSGGHGLIIDFLLYLVRFLGGLVGLIVVLMIIIGGIQYITAGGSPQAVTAAKSRISNAIVALILYILMFGILQFLLPGGVF